MKITSIYFIFLSFLFTACGGNANPGSTDRPTATNSEDQTILQLSTHLIADPQTQAETDQNAIVNHAIDHLIPLERTQSGLFYRIIEPGEGEQLQWGDYISVHYEGSFLDGRQFYSSIRRDKPLQFYIGNMIPGWNEGLQLIAPKGKIQLFVPSAMGYKDEGLPDGKGDLLVPADTPIVFEVEVLERLRRAGDTE